LLGGTQLQYGCSQVQLSQQFEKSSLILVNKCFNSCSYGSFVDANDVVELRKLARSEAILACLDIIEQDWLTSKFKS
jgi:hypothetical protein